MKLLQVGCGNMGKAMLSAWAQNKSFHEAWIVQPSLGAQGIFEHHKNIHFATSIAGVPRSLEPDVVIFANKPQKAIEVVPHYTQFAQSAVYVSIMTGISIPWMTQILGQQTSIVRLMPNMAAQITASMSVATARNLTTSQKEQITKLSEAIGKLLWVDHEHMLEAATPISGSGPAYFFLLTECLANIAKDLGFDKESSETLTKQTILGSAMLLDQSSQSAEELRNSVCSKGGVTLAALDVLNKPEHLKDHLRRAIDAALERAKELRL